MSVVVCSRDRAEILRTCLQALKALQYSSFEVVVVDNAPSTSETSEMFARHFAADSRFRYVEEPAPGLSRARNRGLRTARGEIIAYTDDDVRVDPWWLNGIVEGFARHDGTGCVTGLVLAAELESDAQRYFDSRVSWNSSCEGRIYDQGENRPASPLYPYAAGLFGTGANFAFDRQFLMSLGGFDEALGAGAPTRGGEDLDIFVRAVLSGRPLVYEPAAVVWHTHRSEHGELIEQMYSYGLGLTAYITKFLTDPRTAAKLLFHLPQALIHAKKMLGKGDTGATGRVAALAEKSLLRAELRGMLNGPRAYYRGRRIAGGGWAVRSTASGEAASRPAA